MPDGPTKGEIAMSPAQVRILWLPKRVNHATWADVEALGVVRTGNENFSYFETRVPADWQIVDTDISIYQKRLVDGSGKHLAKLFYKPGSQGGGGSMELINEG